MDIYKFNDDVPLLAISSKKIKNCDKVAEFLMKSGILCNVTSTTSIVKDKNNNIVKEKGCDIKFTQFAEGTTFKNIWTDIKNEYDLTCAHFEIPNKFSGCVNNYFRKSACPLNEVNIQKQ